MANQCSIRLTRSALTGQAIFTALSNIKAGEELYFDYLGAVTLPEAERHAMLLQNYGFDCQCKHCLKGG